MTGLCASLQEFPQDCKVPTVDNWICNMALTPPRCPAAYRGLGFCVVLEQCFGSIFIEFGSSKKSQSGSGSRKALNPDPHPSYFFTLKI